MVNAYENTDDDSILDQTEILELLNAGVDLTDKFCGNAAECDLAAFNTYVNGSPDELLSLEETTVLVEAEVDPFESLSCAYTDPCDFISSHTGFSSQNYLSTSELTEMLEGGATVSEIMSCSLDYISYCEMVNAYENTDDDVRSAEI